MAVLASDDFTRGDNADLGSNWSPIRDTFKIVSNQAAPNSLATDATEVYDGSISWPNNQWAQAAMYGSGGAASGGSGPGLCLRGQQTANGDHYRIAVSIGGANNVIEVGKRISSAFTSLGFIDTTWISGQVLRVEIRGFVISVYKDGTLIGAVTDGGSSLASGKPGVMYSSTMTTSTIDNWFAGDFAGTEYRFNQTLFPKAVPSRFRNPVAS